MLEFERQVVAAVTASDDPSTRAAVAEWVDGCLRAMPEVLRAGVASGSIVLGLWVRLTRREGPDLVRWLEQSPLPPVRQHLRLLRSLALFGELELAPERPR